MAEREHAGKTNAGASELLSAAQGGDLSTFENTVEQYQDDVYALALQMTRSEARALEIAETIFVSAYPHLKDFRTDADFGAWVRRIAAGLTIVRGRQVVPATDNGVRSSVLRERRKPAERYVKDSRHDTDEEALTAELRQAIQDATDQLPQDQREVFLLKDLASLTYEQIAEITCDSIRAIKDRLHRARLTLRDAIDRFYSKERDCTGSDIEPATRT